MGIDVNLYIEGIVTDDELNAAVTFFKERELRGTPTRSTDDPNRIYIDMDGARYYGPHYVRGPWPDIAVCIMAAVAAFPTCTVHYGGDENLDSPIVDDDLLADYWAHYFGPHWNDYRSHVPVVSPREGTQP